MGNNIFNQILDNNNMTKDEIYAFINICAYQQGKLPENKIYAIAPGNNLTYLNITSQRTGVVRLYKSLGRIHREYERSIQKITYYTYDSGII